jgi:hypothetical protein
VEKGQLLGRHRDLDTCVDHRPPGPRDANLAQPRRDRGNSLDDDGNGYVDDGDGWGFRPPRQRPAARILARRLDRPSTLATTARSVRHSGRGDEQRRWHRGRRVELPDHGAESLAPGQHGAHLRERGRALRSRTPWTRVPPSFR